jgi:lysophospholipase L1-like esterase
MPCAPGDCIGVWVAGSSNLARVAAKTLAGSDYGYVAEDVTTSVLAANLTTGADTVLNIEVTGIPPFLAITGDSIAEGHNTVTPWHGAQHVGSGPAGYIESEIGYWLRVYLGGSSMLEYQNVALGGEEFDWVAASAITACLDPLPSAILIHCGTNDLGHGRTWAAVQADLDTIRAAVAGTIDLFIDELLPSNDRNDADAATSRTWNTNLAAWCTANSAVLVQCHDAMGQIRTSTGELDDLADDYNYDGLHLTKAGVMRLAQLIGEAMQEFYG